MHGSAPDIGGRGIANPIGMILSLAMAMRHTLGHAAEAALLEAAVEHALSAGSRTADIAAAGDTGVVGAEGMGDAVLNPLDESALETTSGE
jgi:3-isopropylmalate dehydrogenase